MTGWFWMALAGMVLSAVTNLGYVWRHPGSDINPWRLYVGLLAFVYIPGTAALATGRIDQLTWSEFYIRFSFISWSVWFMPPLILWRRGSDR